MYRTDFWTLWEKVRVDVLREQHWNKYTIKCETDCQPRLDAWDKCPGWCTGKTQRDGMERESGEGIGMGTHVNPWLIHVNVWQKPLQYCKVISFQLIKINGKKLACIWKREIYKWFSEVTKSMFKDDRGIGREWWKQSN